MCAKVKKQVKGKILVVDDEPAITATLEAILEEEGYEVDTACSGEQAVAHAAGFKPNLLITDIIMGAMNGIEAAARISATLPDCRVLFFSGSGTFDKLIRSAPKNLIYSFIRKPMPVPDLLSAIAYIVSTVNTVYDPIDSLDGHSLMQESAQGWRVAELSPVLANR